MPDRRGRSSRVGASSDGGGAASSSASVQSIGSRRHQRVRKRTSSTWATTTIASPSLMFAGISTRSFSFSAGISTLVRPPRSARAASP